MFPLFHSHLDLAHQYWKRLLKKGDWAVDATCGNGHDTLRLTQLISERGGMIGLDIQKQAIKNTKELLEEHLPPQKLKRVHLFCQSHANFPDLALGKPIRLIVYNLGYLPGADKGLTTLADTTLESVKNALNLIPPGAAISVICYPGHPEGRREEAVLLAFCEILPPQQWNVCHHTWKNGEKAPSLLFIQKKIR